MWLLIATIVLYALLESVMVGLSFNAICERFGLRPSPIHSFLLLIPVFSLLAIYYLPALDVLDARLTIGNEEIAREIGPGTPIELRELFRFGISDSVVWVVQAAIATAVCRWTRRPA